MTGHAAPPHRKLVVACTLVATCLALYVLLGPYARSAEPPPAVALDAQPEPLPTAVGPRPRLEVSLEGSMDEFLSAADKATVVRWIREGAPEEGYPRVQAILAQHCVGCHNQDTMPQLPLSTYAEVLTHAQRIESDVVPSPLETSLYESMADYIEEADIPPLVQWLRAGAPEADFVTVQPILEESCAVCHNAEDMPEMPLVTYEDVGRYAESPGHAGPTVVAESGSPLHPAVRLLDDTGVSVLRTGGPVSTIRTCGQCHDTQYIAGHSYHVSAGFGQLGTPGEVVGGRPWDTGPGLFGRWDPLTYRVLTWPGDEQFDVGTADWIRMFGSRHVGGGPAALSREGQPLTELAPTDALDPETHVMDEQSGAVTPWNWKLSGVVEMNCFLCHIAQPDGAAREAELAAGRFRWVATATLASTGLVRPAHEGWEWNAEAFTTTGAVPRRLLGISDPRSEHCGLCHGLVDKHPDAQTVQRALNDWRTETTGQIFSPERLAASGVTTETQNGVSRPWDVHAQRLLECTSCHYSLNNPAYRTPALQPEHLRFDARRNNLGEYLQQPSHQFAKGQSDHGPVAPELERSMRRCESCHNIDTTHDWLPYKQRHMNAMTCESCHIPRLYAPARRQTDWTLLDAEGGALVEYRGAPGNGAGYEPVLFPRHRPEGGVQLTPHNVIASWYWVTGDPERPVRLRDLKAALFVDAQPGVYQETVASVLDTDGNGTLDVAELRLNTPAKVAAVRERLEAVGVESPRIRGEVQPFSLHHNVAPGSWATGTCTTCHGAQSRITRPMVLASYVPGDVLPTLVGYENVRLGGTWGRDVDGALLYRPEADAADLYILGHNRWVLGDRLGVLAIIGVVVGVSIHAIMRILSARGIRLRIHKGKKAAA